jgi:polar amino acid transport system substrate-binding protein
MRVVCVSILSALLLVVASAAGQSPAPASGTLRVAFIAGNPAMVVKNPTTGLPGGPAIDLGRELARRRGVEAVAVGVATPQAVIEAVRDGKADIGFVAYNPEREGAVEFSQPFMLVLQTFLVKQDSPLRSVKDIDQAGLAIGARRADSMALYLARTLKQAKLVEMLEPIGTEGAQAVASGQIAAFGTNRQRLTETLKGPAGAGLRLLPDDLYGVEQTIIVPKGDQAGLAGANQFINDIRNSGFLRGSIERSGVIGVAVAPARDK